MRVAKVTRLQYRILLVVVLAVLLVIYVAHYGSSDCVLLGADDRKICVRMEVADTDAARLKGLSGRQTLPEKYGMLFIFDTPGKHCMWMKDMHVPIDIIWLDNSNNIVHTESHVGPETFPRSFCSPNTALHVIELPAGTIDQAGIATGQTVKI